MKKGIFVSLVLLVLVIISACAIRPSQQSENHNEMINAQSIALQNAFFVEFRDCVTEDCASEVNQYIASRGFVPQSTCTDGIDNDEDELIDTTDPDCNSANIISRTFGTNTCADISCNGPYCISVGNSGSYANSQYTSGNLFSPTSFGPQNINGVICHLPDIDNCLGIDNVGNTIPFNDGVGSAGIATGANPGKGIAGRDNIYVVVGERGDSPGNGGLYQSTNYGASFTLKQNDPDIFFAVTYVLGSGSPGWFVAVGENGVAYISFDGGNTWDDVSATTPNLNGVSCINMGKSVAKCLAFGNGGTIAEGVIEGPIASIVTWEPRDSGISGKIDKGVCLGNNCYATSNAANMMVYSHDSGETWQKVPMQDQIAVTINGEDVVSCGVAGKYGYIEDADQLTQTESDTGPFV